MRDKLCDRDKLIKFIDNRKKFIKEDKQEIVDIQEDIKNNIERHSISNEEWLSKTYAMVFDYYLENIQCKYSLGEPVESIIEDYKEGVYYLSSTERDKGFGTMSRFRTHLIDTFFLFETSFILVR